MPLIDLKTNLRSLGYGKDRPDGGSSNQPYIKTNIPGGDDFVQDLITQTRANDTPLPSAVDFLLRDGYLAAIKSLQDTERIGKYFIDLKSPSGLLFTAKQELLERQNVNVNDGINRIYNPLGTVAQVGVLATGYHLNKQGFNVFREGYYNGGQIGYFTLTNTSNTLGEDKLSLLFKSKISNSADGFETLAGKNLYGITPSSDIVNLISYPGGPGSILGVGKTNIRIQNSTRAVENINSNQKYQPSYISTLIDSPKYLVINNGLRPFVSWKYNPETTSPGVSSLVLSTFTSSLNESFEGETKVKLFTFNISNILNRSEYISDPNLNTSSLNPNINAASNKNGLSSKYDTQITQKHPFINWKYNPKTENPGVSNVAISEFNLEASQASSSFYINDSASLLLNRNGLTPSPLNPNILTTGSNTGDPNKEIIVKRPFINWKYNPKTENPGVSNVFISGNNLNESQTSSFYPDGNVDSLLNRKDLPAPPSNPNNNEYAFSYSQSLSQTSKYTDQSTALISLKDFRQTINENEGKDIIPFTSYSTFNREDKYASSKTTYKGNWNALNGVRELNPNEWISTDQNETGVEGEDIVDFNFTIISNKGGGNLTIDFKAYLETWSDGTKADWSSIKYLGRAENFYKYNGFSRSVGVTFLVPALSRGDMVSNYKKLNQLIWSTAPSYSSGENSTIAGIMRGSITKFTMGNYFKGMPCVIQSVNLSEIEGMGWDINRDLEGTPLSETDSLYVGQLPKGIKVQVDLIPLHNFVPQYGEAFIGQSSKYI